MASPFQQQVRQRKFLYIGLIVVLFTVSIVWRKAVIDGLADAPGHPRGEPGRGRAARRRRAPRPDRLARPGHVHPVGQRDREAEEEPVERAGGAGRSLTRLQPHFITPWLFQSWNLAYNVSVESDRVRDKYFYVSRGIELLAEGERQNRNHPDLRWSIGFYTAAQDLPVGRDELHPLALPAEHHPAQRARPGPVLEADRRRPGVQLRGVREVLPRAPAAGPPAQPRHPAATRRREKKRQFICERPEDVVQFLDDNFSVPSLYVVEPLPADSPAQSRGWTPPRRTPCSTPSSRFPVLPPAARRRVRPRRPVDRLDAARRHRRLRRRPRLVLLRPGAAAGARPACPAPAWTSPTAAAQRRPKNMTTLIFRHYPADGPALHGRAPPGGGLVRRRGLGRRRELFRDSKEPAQAGKQVLVGAGVNWSLRRLDAGQGRLGEARPRTTTCSSPARRERADRDATWRERFAEEVPHPALRPPAALAEDHLSRRGRRGYEAAKFMYEYEFYRNLTNFTHHYIRADRRGAARDGRVPQDVLQGRAGEPRRLPAGRPAHLPDAGRVRFGGGRRKLDPLTAWRDWSCCRTRSSAATASSRR